ncbi:MAG: hypothetical protein ACRDK3_00470 [Actinomycetota bacterium]
MTEERKTGLLTIKNIRRVAFVERGANQLANIAMVKSADTDPQNPVPTEKGRSAMTQTQVMERIEKAASELRSSDDSLTREQAISKVMDVRPDLVDEYRNSEPDFSIESPKEPEPTEIQKTEADIVAIAKSHGEGSSEYAQAMAKRLDLLGHEDQAEDWRAQAAFIG